MLYNTEVWSGWGKGGFLQMHLAMTSCTPIHEQRMAVTEDRGYTRTKVHTDTARSQLACLCRGIKLLAIVHALNLTW